MVVETVPLAGLSTFCLPNNDEKSQAYCIIFILPLRDHYGIFLSQHLEVVRSHRG